MAVPDLPNFQGDAGPKKGKFLQLVAFIRSLIPISGYGIHVFRTPGGTTFTLSAPDSPRWAKATESIAAPTWDGTDFACAKGDVTFLIKDGDDSTLHTESVEARNCLMGQTGVSSGELLLLAWIEDRWDIIGRECI